MVNMSPHDLELKLYNDIVKSLDQIDFCLQIIANDEDYNNSSVALRAVLHLMDTRAMFRLYAERYHG